MTKTAKQKTLAGELYRPGDPELQADAAANKAWLARYNAALAAPASGRHALLSEHFGHFGRDAAIRPPSFATMATTSTSATRCSSISTASSST